MVIFLDSTLLHNPRVRRWFLVGLILLPLLLSASGLGSYYMAEAFMYLKPESWSDIKRHMIKEDWGEEFYRPMARIIPALYYKLFGTNPIIPRAIQFLTYAATCLLAFLILEALSQSFIVGAVGALIFAVMPSHVESMFQLAQGITLNATFCSLLVFWLLGPGYRNRPSWARIPIACLAFAFGLLSYPNVLLTPVFLALYEAIWWPKEGFARVKRRVLRCHLPLWIIALVFLGLRFYQLSQVGDQASWYLGAVKSLTVTQAIVNLIPIVYATVCPLQLSPVLSLAAAFLLYFGFKHQWRFTLFLLLFTLVAPALSYPQTLVMSRRVYLASLGTAGLLAFLLISCLGGLLDRKRRPAVVSFLDWVVVGSMGYWVFELLRVGWLGFFCETGLTYNLRFYAAALAGVGVLLRCIISKSALPKLSKAPLVSLSVGLISLIMVFYAAGFLKVLSISITECDEVSRIPRAIVAAQPDVPDDALILLVFDEDLSIPEEQALAGNTRGPIRAEFGQNVVPFGFKSWVSGNQHNSILKDNTLMAFRIAGDKAVEDRELAARILSRQESYLAITDDVVHARTVAKQPTTQPIQLTPEVHPMNIDRAEFYITEPSPSLIAQLEFLSDGAPVALRLPAVAEGTKATVRLDREPKWLLADGPVQVRTSVFAGQSRIPVEEVRLLQTKGLVREEPLQALPKFPWAHACKTDSALARVRTCFRMDDLSRCIALP